MLKEGRGGGGGIVVSVLHRVTWHAQVKARVEGERWGGGGGGWGGHPRVCTGT